MLAQYLSPGPTMSCKAALAAALSVFFPERKECGWVRAGARPGLQHAAVLQWVQWLVPSLPRQHWVTSAGCCSAAQAFVYSAALQHCRPAVSISNRPGKRGLVTITKRDGRHLIRRRHSPSARGAAVNRAAVHAATCSTSTAALRTSDPDLACRLCPVDWGGAMQLDWSMLWTWPTQYAVSRVTGRLRLSSLLAYFAAGFFWHFFPLQCGLFVQRVQQGSLLGENLLDRES